MRILQIHSRYREQGGEDIVARAERELLESAGNEVIEVQRENASNPIRAAAQLAGYTCNPLSTGAIVKVAKRTHPDIAHFHNTWFAVSPDALRSLQRIGIPTVVTIHNYRLVCANAQLLRDGAPCELCVGSSPWAGVRHRCYRNSSIASAAAALGIETHRLRRTWHRGVDKFLALTEFARGRLIAGGLPAERIAVHPNFVADSGRRTRPPSASKRVTYVGRLSPEKGLTVLLDAWAEAAPAGLELSIVGDGPQREQLVQRATRSVTFHGQLGRAEVSALLLDSRAAVFPSVWYEGQPLAVLEALAAGLPVAGSAIGGLDETIAPLGDSWCVTPGSTRAWANVLLQLSDDGLIDDRGRAARCLYEERYTPLIAQERLATTYRLLCGL